MNEKWTQPTMWIRVHRVGFYTFLICTSLALGVDGTHQALDLSYSTRVYVQEDLTGRSIFNSFLCELVCLHGFLRRYLFGSKISFAVKGMDSLRGNPIQYAVRHQRIFGSITICFDWWGIHLATVLSVTCLHQRRAILANRDIQRDTFPPIYHGLWHSPPRMKLSAVKSRGKKTL